MQGQLTPEQQLQVLSRTCNHCGETKPITEFAVRKRNGAYQYRLQCVPCWAKRAEVYRNKYTDQEWAAYRQKGKLRRKYGLGPDEYRAMVEVRGSRCDICGQVAELQVDHDHLTNVVRGLLCFNCNIGIGHFKDDVKILKSAIAYLKADL